MDDPTEDDLLFRRLAIGKQLTNAAQSRQHQLDLNIQRLTAAITTKRASMKKLTTESAAATRLDLQLMKSYVQDMKKDAAVIEQLRKGIQEAFSYTRLSTLPTALSLTTTLQSQQEFQQLQQELERARKQAERGSSTLQALIECEKQLVELQTNFHTAQGVYSQQISDLKVQNERYKSELIELARENRRCKGRQTTLEQQLLEAKRRPTVSTQMQLQVNQLEQQLSEEKRRTAELQERLKETRVVAATRERILAALQGKSEACNNELTAEKERNETCKLQLESTISQLAAARRELQSLRTASQTVPAEVEEENESIDLQLVKKYAALSMYYVSLFSSVYSSSTELKVAVPFSLADKQKMTQAFLASNSAAFYTYIMELMQAMVYDNFTQEAVLVLSDTDGVRHYVLSAEKVSDEEFGTAKQRALLPKNFVSSMYSLSTLLVLITAYHVSSVLNTVCSLFKSRDEDVRAVILSETELLFTMFTTDYNVDRSRTRIHLFRRFVWSDYSQLLQTRGNPDSTLSFQDFIELRSRTAINPESFVRPAKMTQLQAIRMRAASINADSNWLPGVMSRCANRLLPDGPVANYPLLSSLL